MLTNNTYRSLLRNLHSQFSILHSQLIIFFFLFTTSLFAQQPPATPAASRLSGYNTRKQLQENSAIKNITFRSVGPTVMSGRVVDVDANPADPAHFFVAYASGGLWETRDNGTSFEPRFEGMPVMTIGDIAVDWTKPSPVIWLGSGENNSSRSSYSGTGMYRSTDGGKTWQHLGLEESHHIGRIVLHPTNPNIALVAVLGHLYSPNAERGVYRTLDGGKTWEKNLFVNENTGAIDLAIDPANPQILYAAMWQRERRAWKFAGSGEGSGIYKSEDGGKVWKLLTTAQSGFPSGEGTGRIGLAVGKGVVYAVIDNQFRKEKEPKEDEGLTKEDFRNISKEDFLKLDKKKVEKFLKANDFPEKYTVDNVFSKIENDEVKPLALVEYLEDANSLLFDTDVKGTEVYRSNDGGKTWQKTHEGYIDEVFYTYGYYFAQIRVSPFNTNKIYIMGVPLVMSEDGGKNWKGINSDNMHGDHHALWLDPNKDGHLINGNDGGVNISWNDGKDWLKCNRPPVGQFYTVNVDHAEPYRVYGGLQDNGVWRGPSDYQASTGWQNNGSYPYKELMGGDGMQVQIDPRDNETVYTGYQFGNYYRVDARTGMIKYIQPRHELGQRPYRFNWQTPIHLSTFNPDILYLGSNVLHRSMDKGETWTAISPDLTQGGKKGEVPYGTLTSVHESPMRFGLIYAGSDDGLVHVTRDGGYSWQKITDGLPKDMWVSRVQASAFREGRAYVCLNGYRWDDFNSYIYTTDDYGAHWSRMGLDLPAEPVNVLREDPTNPDLLYVGTDHGLYVSIDRGKTFQAMTGGLPAAPVHDLVIHDKASDLVVGTHGRSIWIASVKELQQLKRELTDKPLTLFEFPTVNYRGSWGSGMWFGVDTPSVRLPYYAAQAGEVEVRIETEGGLLLTTLKDQAEKGLNYLHYDLTFSKVRLEEFENELNKEKEDDKKDEKKEAKEPIKIKEAKNKKYYLRKGKYNVKLLQGKEKAEAVLEVK